MKLKIFQVDAFADRLFAGNPAAVVPLENWLPDQLLQQIAAENNLAETAFFIQQETGRFGLRWFTPAVEVDLCGHATLATAFILFQKLKWKGGDSQPDTVFFETRSGLLSVKKEAAGGLFTLDFPTDRLSKSEVSRAFIEEMVGIRPVEIWEGRSDLMAVFSKRKDIENLQPDFLKMKSLPHRGLICTAKGSGETDFVSRFFAPQSGIDEDPVTGSAHTTLTPFWAERLGKMDLNAEQISPRGGKLRCQLMGDRVLISGKARLYLEGKISV